MASLKRGPMCHVTIEIETDELLATTSVGQGQENSFNALI